MIYARCDCDAVKRHPFQCSFSELRHTFVTSNFVVISRLDNRKEFTTNDILKRRDDPSSNVYGPGVLFRPKRTYEIRATINRASNIVTSKKYVSQNCTKLFHKTVVKSPSYE